MHALVSIIGCNEILSHPLFLAHTHTACPPGLHQYHPRSHPPAGYLLPHSHLPWRGIKERAKVLTVCCHRKWQLIPPPPPLFPLLVCPLSLSLSLYSSSRLLPFFLDFPACDRPSQPGRNRATRRCLTMKTSDSSSRHPLMMHR